MTSSPGHDPRVAPRVWLGLIAVVMYLAVFYGVWIVNGIDYPRIGDSEDTLFKWYVAPLAAGCVVLVIVVSIYGWWRPSLVETTKRLPAWVWLFPGLLAIGAIVGVLTGDISRLTPTMWLALTVGSLLVGFNEELMARGQLVVALRSRFGEVGVWGFSSLVFAAIHIPNIFFGTGVLGIGQVVITFMLGTVFYLLRRVSGTLIAAMILHGLWDFSTLAASSQVAAFLGIATGIAAVIVTIVLLRKESRTEKTVAA